MSAIDEMRAALAAAKASNERIAAELAKARADRERLRDAAPDLLAALVALEGSFEKHRPKAMWDAARAAIAKATAP